MAKFEFELGKPHKSLPAGLPGFRQSQPQRVPRHHPGHEPGSPNAPGHPGAGVSILISYGVKPLYVKLPIFSEFMENSGLTKWTQNLR